MNNQLSLDTSSPINYQHQSYNIRNLISHSQTQEDTCNNEVHQVGQVRRRQPTPRLPRGVSRIPHRVTSSESTSAFQVSSPETPEAALRQAQVPHNSNLQLQQQPVCEAFIMTGQSMLKLSTDATDQHNNNNNNSHLISDKNSKQNSASYKQQQQQPQTNKPDDHPTHEARERRQSSRQTDASFASSQMDLSHTTTQLRQQLATTKGHNNDAVEELTDATAAAQHRHRRIQRRIDGSTFTAINNNSSSNDDDDDDDENAAVAAHMSCSDGAIGAAASVVATTARQKQRSGDNATIAACRSKTFTKNDANATILDRAYIFDNIRTRTLSSGDETLQNASLASAPKSTYLQNNPQHYCKDLTKQNSACSKSSFYIEYLRHIDSINTPKSTIRSHSQQQLQTPPIDTMATTQNKTEPSTPISNGHSSANHHNENHHRINGCSNQNHDADKVDPNTTRSGEEQSDGFDNEPQSKQQQQPPSPGSQSANTSFPACNDRESARRLAKRLYNLSGFKRSDVCHHLAKNNPFSQMVAEEFLNLFDFRSMKLDGALRKFLSKLQINGETQERERLLSKFSQRYYDCNKEKFPSSEAVQTLVCAMILLNTDLHGNHHHYGDKKNRKRTKLSLGAFIDGLNSSVAALTRPEDTLDSSNGSNIALGSNQINNNMAGYTFPRHLLVDLYESVKKRPLKCGDDKCDMSSLEAELDRIYSQQVSSGRSNTLPSRRTMFGAGMGSTLGASSRRLLRHDRSRLDTGVSETAIEFKNGYLNRKRVFDAKGKPTSKGNRGWRRFNIVLQDLRLIMLPSGSISANSSPKGDSNENTTNNNTNKQSFDEQPTAKQQLNRTKSQTLDPDMKNTVRIHHSIAKRSTSYTKRDFVFHLKLADQSEYLLQAEDEREMISWIDTINFASSCLSSPALPSAVCNNSTNSQSNGTSCDNIRRKMQQNRLTRRTILSSAYTRLSYWEQLIDHEEHLKRLNAELNDHLNEATNTCNANKRSKTEFIERIAYLKYEIERYTVYVDLMRRKSNSPEAIILSKHPQIASLTPSNEMIKSLPLSSNTSPKSSPQINRRVAN